MVSKRNTAGLLSMVIIVGYSAWFGYHRPPVLPNNFGIAISLYEDIHTVQDTNLSMPWFNIHHSVPVCLIERALAYYFELEQVKSCFSQVVTLYAALVAPHLTPTTMITVTVIKFQSTG